MEIGRRGLGCMRARHVEALARPPTAGSVAAQEWAGLGHLALQSLKMGLHSVPRRVVELSPTATRDSRHSK
jgi:hypothetical protein